MAMKKALILISFLMSSAIAKAQFVSSVFNGQYIKIEGYGLLNNQVEHADQLTDTIRTANGFVTVNRAAIKQINTRYALNAYFNTDSPDASKTIAFNKANHQIYLAVNRSLTIDVVELASGSKLKRYVLMYVKRSPALNIITDNAHVANGLIAIDTALTEQRISLNPGQRLTFGLSKPGDFANADVQFSLYNLTTKTRVKEMDKPNAGTLVVEANTRYVLRYYYMQQPESAGIVYIDVKPHWYQSLLFYLIAAGTIGGVLILLVTLRLKQRIKRTTRDREELEQQAIRLQALLNPHFTFNALSTLQGLINTGRTDEANAYLEAFSALLRNTLAKSRQIVNRLDQELEMMQTYINLEAIRFNFTWALTVDERLSPTDVEIPTLLWQPLVENAIKHGISGRGAKGTLTITCHIKPGNQLEISISDNGKWKTGEPENGHGLNLIRDRIATLNLLYPEQQISLRVQKEPGTQVILTFYNWINE